MKYPNTNNQYKNNQFKVGLFAPADCVDKFRFQKALNKFNLKFKNINIIQPRNLFEKHGLFAGTDKQKIEDLNFLIDQKPDMLLGVKGGYGSARLLEQINYPKIKKNKISIMGYSDLTALLLAVYSQTEQPVFYGYMLTADFCDGITRKQYDLFYKAINREPIDYFYKKKYIKKPLNNCCKLTGVSIAGCLSVLTGLAGAEYFKIFNKQNILFIEDINEEPYKIDRMLTHLKNAGAFKNTKCLFLDFNKCTPSEKNKNTISIKQSILEIFESFNFPVIDFPAFGHRQNRVIIPIGSHTQVDILSSTISFS